MAFSAAVLYFGLYRGPTVWIMSLQGHHSSGKRRMSSAASRSPRKRSTHGPGMQRASGGRDSLARSAFL